MNKKVLITGISSGIGHALAKYYLDNGDQVFGISRRTPADLTESDSMNFVSADLESLDSVANTIQELLSGVEKLDLVILNAAVLGTVSDIQEADMSELRQTMDINLWSNKIIIDTLLDLPIQLPQIIAISSGAAVNPQRGWGGYTLSKASLNALIKLYACEVDDTHFVAMAPGLVDTQMQDYLCGEIDDPKFTSVERIKKARNTPNMPTASRLIPAMVQAFEDVKTIPSGDYIDIRDMDIYQTIRDTATK